MRLPGRLHDRSAGSSHEHPRCGIFGQPGWPPTRVYDTTSGRVIWDVDTVGDLDTINGVPARGGSINGPGPTVAGGMLFVTSGYGALGFMPGNVLLAFSVDGQ